MPLAQPIALGDTPVVSNWIGGRAVTGHAREQGAVFDPALGCAVARVPLAGEADLDAAVASASEAWPAWAATPAVQRARVLFRFKALIENRLDELAAIVTREHGKTLADARGSIRRGLEVVEFACGIPHLLKGEYSEGVGRGIDSWSIRQPLGVCAGVTPFNFPAMIPLWMFPLAVACGNTFILKPSEKVPSCALRLAELFTEAGAPPGVCNVLHGDRRVVEAMLAHPGITALSFVGSTSVARHVYASGAAHGKRIQALGGAKNHLVVMPDADLEAAADALIGAAFGSAGQRCMAISVAVAVGAAAAPLIEHLTKRIARMRVGPGDAASSDMGPLITAEHRARVLDVIDAGVREGAQLVVDGRTLEVPGSQGGFFLGPCLFDRVTPAMRIHRDEIFGPVLCVSRVGNLAEAMAVMNGHPYANGSSIFTRDGAAARQFAAAADPGMVGINVPIPVPMAFHSFGGWKHSLFGDAPMHGTEGVRFYTRLKTVTARWPDEKDAAEFAMPVAR